MAATGWLFLKGFVLALSDAVAYQMLYHATPPQYVNDFNYDYQLDLLDIDGLVNVLMGS